MDIFGSNLISAAGTAAQDKVASVLAPKNAQVKTTATAKDTPNSSTDDSTDAITADDFMTLLVSELKNQDPTQPTDPATYIQQMVGVSSLQQLTQINQGLSILESGVTVTP
ncbi:flagellar hook capping FlgD N-terminal domain-containing protein [Granulicella sp. dw_53]|uniref:flagellar hook assembly protein FlgD n=1 Tax=Granulicella sp. dw_53 TaxID=2719792 RepID=UPI001BD25CD3|nr:flagellar hook capping FlgD N-terminal domain-containing protein [Granulicella sp. dw_53]